MLIPKILNANVQYLNVNHIRDFIHVNDVVSAIQIMMDNSFRGVIDVGTGIGNKLVDIADYFKIDYKSVIGDETERLDNTADISILNKFGWRAKINLYNYIEENRNVN
jgi:nucleoside-diphosphate-sugar epimerase